MENPKVNRKQETILNQLQIGHSSPNVQLLDK